MTPAGVVEPVDVLEDGCFGLASGRPFLPPDDLSLQAFEERLNCSIVITIASAAHRWSQAVGLQLLLEVV